MQGLRRELALPTSRDPGRRRCGHVAEEGGRGVVGRRSLSYDDPLLLDELLALPRAHLVVDGYNVTKTGLARDVARAPA